MALNKNPRQGISSTDLMAAIEALDNVDGLKASMAASVAPSHPRSFLRIARPLLARISSGEQPPTSQENASKLLEAIASHPSLLRLFLAELRNANSPYFSAAPLPCWVRAIMASPKTSEAWRSARLSSIAPALSRCDPSVIFEALGVACAAGSLAGARILADIYPDSRNANGSMRHARGILSHAREGFGSSEAQASARLLLAEPDPAPTGLVAGLPTNAFFWIAERWQASRASHPREASEWAQIGCQMIEKAARPVGSAELAACLMSCAPIAQRALDAHISIFSQQEPMRREALLRAFSRMSAEDVPTVCALDEAAYESPHVDPGTLGRAPAAALALMAGSVAGEEMRVAMTACSGRIFLIPKQALDQAKSGASISTDWESFAPSSKKIFTLASLAKAIEKARLPSRPKLSGQAPRS